MKRLSKNTRDAFYRQAASQGPNNIGVIEILEDFQRRMMRRGRKAEAELFGRVAAEVRDGKPLAEALGQSIGDVERQILAAGEEAGDLWSAMSLALTLRELTDSIRSAFITALTSPVILGLSLWACLAIIGLRVTPAFVGMLPVAQWGPWAKTMYYAGEAAASWWGVVAVALLLLASAWSAWARSHWTGPGRAFCDRFVFPFTLFRDMEGFTWLMTYSALLRAKVPETRALEMQMLTGTGYIRSRLKPVLARLNNGRTLPDALRGSGYGFPAPDLVDEIEAYAGFKDFAVKAEGAGRVYATELQRQLKAKAAMTGAIFGGLVFVVMGVVQLGANEIQSAIMSTVGARI